MDDLSGHLADFFENTPTEMAEAIIGVAHETQQIMPKLLEEKFGRKPITLTTEDVLLMVVTLQEAVSQLLPNNTIMAAIIAILQQHTTTLMASLLETHEKGELATALRNHPQNATPAGTTDILKNIVLSDDDLKKLNDILKG